MPDLDHLLRLSERRVDLLIAEYLTDQDLGSREDDDEERLFIARRWFAALHGRLRSAICGRESVRRALDDPGENNHLLVAAIIDALVSAGFEVDVPVAVIAVKVTHFGIRRICAEAS